MCRNQFVDKKVLSQMCWLYNNIMIHVAVKIHFDFLNVNPADSNYCCLFQ